MFIRIAEHRQLEAFPDTTRLFEPGTKNYRVPDASIIDPKYVSERGLEGRDGTDMYEVGIRDTI